jgi:hypothetical protein
MYPNPVYSSLKIENSERIECVAVYNLIGQKILEVSPGTNNLNLDMSHFTNGIYVVHVNDGATTTIKKVVKK